MARLDYGARPDLLRAFPFPHVLTIDAQLTDRTLQLTTEVRPTGRSAVPISFCWHPYLRLPGAPRRDWVLRWPACDRVLVDERVLPTGATLAQPAERAPLAKRTFDDHYALGADRRFSLEAGGRRIELRFGPTYPFAQLFVPAQGDFAAIEPMTATIDALGRGLAPTRRAGRPVPRPVHDHRRLTRRRRHKGAGRSPPPWSPGGTQSLSPTRPRYGSAQPNPWLTARLIDALGVQVSPV